MKAVRSGFTLVEILLSLVLVSIVMGGVVFAINASLKIYEKAEVHSSVLNGLRFTVDSYNRLVSPVLNITKDIAILSADAVNIPYSSALSDDEHYLYVSGDALVVRSKTGDYVFPGSEYIKNIVFSVPCPTVADGYNYILDITVSAGYGEIIKSADIKESLYNMPLKNGNINYSRNNYEGNVLRFVGKLKTADVEMSVGNLRTLDKNLEKDISEVMDVDRKTKLEASYDLTLKSDADEIYAVYEDKSVFEWYISAAVNPAAPITQESPSIYNMNMFKWKICKSDGSGITGSVFDPNGIIYTLVNGKAKKWPDSYSRVIFWKMSPIFTVTDHDYIMEDKWGPYIKYADAPVEQGSLISDWSEMVKGCKNTNGFSVTLAGSDPKIFNLEVNGSDAIVITVKSHESQYYGAVTVAKLDYKYMDNDMIYNIWKNRQFALSSDIPSYMTMTNYSVVVDATLEKAGDRGYGIALSSTTTSTDAYIDDGYIIQFDSGADGLPVRLFENGVHNPAMTYGIESVYSTNSKENNNYYSPYHLNNEIFHFEKGSSSSEWKERHRILYTVLEYYIDGNKQKPCYIFRVRFLKPKSTDTAVLNKDPWCIGPDFYASEPAWYGDFVGTTPVYSSSLEGKSTVAVRRYRSGPDAESEASVNEYLNESHRYYGIKYNNQTSTDRIFVNKLIQRSGNVFSNLARDRYIGIRLWQNDNATTSVIVHDIVLVPGFSANEIRSLMPAGGKVYEIDETVTQYAAASVERTTLSAIQKTNWYKSYKEVSNGDYNKLLFGRSARSGGDGNNGSLYYTRAKSSSRDKLSGIYNLQHMPNETGVYCPLHNELFKWLGN